MARNTIVTNTSRQALNLYPYKGLLDPGESVVISTTPEDFLSDFGGPDGAVSSMLSVSSTGAPATIGKSFVSKSGSAIVDSTTGYADSQRIEVSTVSDVATVVLEKATGGDIDPDIIYTIKDVGGNASTNNITISCSSTFVDSSASTYVISTDYASVGVYKSSVSGRFAVLPGVSSGGGGSSTPTQEYLSSATVAIAAMVDTVLIQKSGAPCTVTLPAITAALDGNITSIKMEIADVAGAAGTHTITIQPNAGDTGTLINGAANATITSNYGSVTLQAVNYDGITYGAGHDESRSGKHWKLS